MSSTPSIVSIGECTLDDYFLQGETHVGGIALNFAVHAARAGARSALVSRVGTDGDAQVRAALRENGVDAAHVSVDASQPTACQRIALHADGERVFPPGGYTFGAMHGFLPDAAALRFIATHDALACPCYTQALPLFRHMLSQPFAGTRMADFSDLADFDHDVSFIAKHAPALGIAFVGADAALAEPMRQLSLHTDCLLVLTLGARGSLAFVHGARVYQEAMGIPQVQDTTGCGDAFQAAFAVQWLRNGDVQASLATGAAQAARVAAIKGAF